MVQLSEPISDTQNQYQRRNHLETKYETRNAITNERFIYSAFAGPTLQIGPLCDPPEAEPYGFWNKAEDRQRKWNARAMVECLMRPFLLALHARLLSSGVRRRNDQCQTQCFKKNRNHIQTHIQKRIQIQIQYSTRTRTSARDRVRRRTDASNSRTR